MKQSNINTIPFPEDGESTASYYKRLISLGFSGSKECSTVDNIQKQEKIKQSNLNDEMIGELLDCIPATGSIGNISLREKLLSRSNSWSESNFWEIRQLGIDRGLIGVGKGRGGSVFKIESSPPPSYSSAEISGARGDYQEDREEMTLKLQRAHEFYKNREFGRALQEWEVLAGQGVSAALYNLGLHYHKAVGTAEGIKTGIKYYTLAANKGHAKAQFNLGSLLVDGNTDEENKGISLLTKAAEQGLSEAQFKIAYLYKTGKPGIQDKVKSFYWFKKSAEAGHFLSKYFLGQAYKTGDGCIKNNELANSLNLDAAIGGVAQAEYEEYLKNIEMDPKVGGDWLIKAACHGDKDAAFIAGDTFLCGNTPMGFEENLEKALEWWRKGASLGSIESQEALYDAYTQGYGFPDERAPNDQWLSNVAEQGDLIAQFVLGERCLSSAKTPEQENNAYRWFLVSATAGYPRAQLALAMSYLNGIGTDISYEKAHRWLGEAYRQEKLGECTDGTTRIEAIFQMAIMYANGQGVERNLSTAYEIMLDAASGGHSDAQFYVGEMLKNGLGIDQDKKTSVIWYTRSADAGHLLAGVRMGQAYLEGIGVPEHSIIGMAYILWADSHGEPSAKSMLGEINPAREVIVQAKKLVAKMNSLGVNDAIESYLKPKKRKTNKTTE